MDIGLSIIKDVVKKKDKILRLH